MSGSDWGGPTGFGIICTGKDTCLSVPPNTIYFSGICWRSGFCIQLQKDLLWKHLSVDWFMVGEIKKSSLENTLWRESAHQISSGLLHWMTHMEGLAGHWIFLFTAWAFFVETWWILSSMWLCHPGSILAVWQCDVGPWIRAGGCLQISLHNYLTVQ